MDELTNQTLPEEKVVIKKKKPIKKRTSFVTHTNINGRNTEVKYSSRPKMVLCKNPSIVSIYAYLKDETHAKFQYLKNPTEDYFYKCLESLKEQHIKYLGEEPENYRTPYDTLCFKFRSAKRFLVCSNKKGNLLMWKDCVGKRVSIKLRVRPYDFISKKNNNRCVGLSIIVSSVELL